MNLLIDLIPTKVEIDNIEYDINFDFRISILFEMLMQDKDIPEDEKIKIALELYYPILPPNINEAIENILWFYKCGKNNHNSNKKVSRKNSSNITKQVYSFDFDDDYIYSAFLDQYNIDLQDVDTLHWWKFKAMFKNLKEDNMIVKIIGYRSMDLSEIEDKEQKKFYIKMKDIYKLPDNEKDIEKINDIEKALLNDEDLERIL